MRAGRNAAKRLLRSDIVHCGECTYPGAYRDPKPSDVVAVQFHFSGMQASADLYSEIFHIQPGFADHKTNEAGR